MSELRAAAGRRQVPLGWRVGLLVALPALIGLVFNALRPGPLPWTAREPYAILHDCPETTATAGVITASAALLRSGQSVFVDASATAAFERAHVRGALNVPFDPLLSVTDTSLAAIRATHASRILVYGAEGTGHALADELATHDVVGVLWVEGDLTALRDAGASIALEGSTP